MTSPSPVKQCFSSIQSRSQWAPIVAGQLCPSMDLILLSFCFQNQDNCRYWISLHRTLTWQKLATLEYNPPNTENEDTTTASNIQFEWSPDGRTMAVALPNGNVQLHHMESILSPNVNASNNVVRGGLQSAAGETGLVHVIPLKETIVGLCWCHVGKPHARWNLSELELEQAETWKYKSRYLDRALVFLPPSSYHANDDQQQQQHAGAPAHTDQHATLLSLPSCKTPLSVLCVATASHGIYLYLHGHYHVATLPPPTRHSTAKNSQMVCSDDLAHVLLYFEQHLVLHHLPGLARNRHDYQVLSSLYCSISSHVRNMQTTTHEVLASFKAALFPLNAKLDHLVKLLKQHGISTSLADVFLKYLVKGLHSSSALSAMDQFFAGVQMNDVLVQRMERSLHGAVSRVESQARRGLLAPAQALMMHVGDLQGHLESDMESNDTRQALELYRACEVLLVSIQHWITLLVEFRFRLENFMAWLRSVASQIKAKGTAADSAFRTNAKKRRVPQVVVSRVTRYLQTTTSSGGTTEQLLGVPLSNFFADAQDVVSCKRPSSPKSVESLTTSDSGEKDVGTIQTPNIVYAARQVSKLVEHVFEQPRKTLSDSVTTADLSLSGVLKESKVVAIHTRIGMDGPNEKPIENPFATDTSHTTGFFFPRLKDNETLYSYSRHWAIVATNRTIKNQETIQLLCLPLGQPQQEEEFDDDSMDCDEYKTNEMKYCLASRLVLPPYCRVKEICFYGDNGKSSLSSGSDSGTGQEGRQAMSLLVDRRCDNDKDDGLVSEELWLLPYKNVVYQTIPIHNDPTVDNRDSFKRVVLGEIEDCVSANVMPIRDVHDDSIEHVVGTTVYAKTRQLRTYEVDSETEAASACSRLMMSGSRGIGGVFTTLSSNSTQTALDLYDLEEDDEDEEDSVEDDDNEV